MKQRALKRGECVYLCPDALYADGLNVPRRFSHRSYPVLSVGPKSALLGGMMQHVGQEFLLQLDESEPL